MMDKTKQMSISIKRDEKREANSYLRKMSHQITRKLHIGFFGCKFYVPWRMSTDKVDQLMHQRAVIENAIRSNLWYREKGYICNNEPIPFNTSDIDIEEDIC